MGRHLSRHSSTAASEERTMRCTNATASRCACREGAGRGRREAGGGYEGLFAK